MSMRVTATPILMTTQEVGGGILEDKAKNQ